MLPGESFIFDEFYQNFRFFLEKEYTLTNEIDGEIMNLWANPHKCDCDKHTYSDRKTELCFFM